MELLIAIIGVVGVVGIVIVWIACAFGCAAIAKSKNRSTLVWFLLGLILGILGLLIIGFMKAKEVDGHSQFPCPSCAEMILVQSTVCRYCGIDLPELDSPTGNVMPSEPTITLPKWVVGLGVFVFIVLVLVIAAVIRMQ